MCTKLTSYIEMTFITFTKARKFRLCTQLVEIICLAPVVFKVNTANISVFEYF